MKKRSLLSLFGVILLAASIFISCEKESTAIEEVSEHVIFKEALSKLEKAHFKTQNARQIEFMGETGIAVEDMFFTLEQIDELSQIEIGPNQKQYRTTNLVTGLPRLITVSVDPSLGTLGSNALDAMINMYNSENLQLTFQRVAFGLKGKNQAAIEVTEFYELESGGFITLGRAAGFPTRKGDPAKGFGINSRWFELLNPSLAEVTGTMAHEVGHCIGFRHTDYMTRESCGQNVNEGSARVGAIHISGTPTVSDATSLMQSCGPANNFNNNDKIALDVLY
ncbi:M57 family metalloprotease [Aquimarina intermedia]|uniref:Dual-action HEIGH metallo-peptidase n=1 Tax=Aquimarina intermedia TaxID=350814 RepID=A0A5S5C3D2_9FLAO|nr:M57 family metalloprotease [Aquimarina intermedia]TYP72830.1 dual-action HEIGH metallo-peptidase [Aquimarina intermedia]